MSGFEAGHSFATGNAVVAQLPVGSTLRVSAQGELTIEEVAQQSFEEGDRIKTKYGPSTVVRMTNRLDNPLDGEEGRVLYIADGTAVVRVADVSNVSRI